MSVTTFIQIILVLNVFIIGVLSPYIYRYARAHFGHNPQPSEPEEASVKATVEHLPPAVKAHLLEDAEKKFQYAIDHSATTLRLNLKGTAEQVDVLVKRLATEIVGNELERYQAELAHLRQQAATDMGSIKTAIDSHQTELKANLDKEIQAERQKITLQMEAEKKHLLDQINTKLADAVASFLLEALKHNVDLGNQGAYLTALLEEHKADFTQEVADETKPS